MPTDTLALTLSSYLGLGKSRLPTLSWLIIGLVLAAVRLLKLKVPRVLCLDRANWRIGRHDVNITMLAIATGRLRSPLLWPVLDRAGSGHRWQRIALMRRTPALSGSGARQLADLRVHAFVTKHL